MDRYDSRKRALSWNYDSYSTNYHSMSFFQLRLCDIQALKKPLMWISCAYHAKMYSREPGTLEPQEARLCYVCRSWLGVLIPLLLFSFRRRCCCGRRKKFVERTQSSVLRESRIQCGHKTYRGRSHSRPRSKCIYGNITILCASVPQILTARRR